MKELYLLIIINLSVNGQNVTELGGESWKVSNGVIQQKGSSSDAIVIKYWDYLNNKLPANLLKKYVYSLRLFTDGIDEELGGMTPMNDFNSKWEIDIDTLDFNFKNNDSLHVQDYLHTIIHEFGHLLTLNPEQIKITEDVIQNDKKGYLTSEGYANNDSYLGRFVNLFWNNNILKKWDKIDKVRNEKRRTNLLYTFYLKNEQQFTTDYAAESPEEDIAESWTFFILSEKPVLDKVKHKKVLFFYQFPELIGYRTKIRKKLDFIPDKYLENYRSKVKF